MRQTSGAALFRSFSETLARVFRWHRSSAPPSPGMANPAVRSASETKPKVIVLSAPQTWLSEFTWDRVVSFNQSQCRLQNTQTVPNPKSHDAVRQLWEARLNQPMSLVKALHFCKECHDRSPFVFSNSSTFSMVAKGVVEALIKDLPPVEAHIVGTTAAHYVSGRVSKRELLEIVRAYESRWSVLVHARAGGNGHVEKRPPEAR